MKMKLEGTEKVIAKIDTPEFKKHPLLGVSIGGHYNKWFGYVRGDNFGVIGIFGIYISFRLPYQPSIVYGQGVDAGFNAAAKTVGYLLNKVNQQAAIIKQLTTMLEEVQEHLDEEDDEDEDGGFKPNWN
jgi:hypothetical protein